MHRGDHDVAEALALLLAVAGRARVCSGALDVPDRAGRVAGPEAKLPGKAEGPGETSLVAELLEDAERLLEPRSDLVVTGKRVREDIDVRERHERVGLDEPVAGRAST